MIVIVIAPKWWSCDLYLYLPLGQEGIELQIKLQVLEDLLYLLLYYTFEHE